MDVLGIPLSALLGQLLLGLVNGSFYAMLSLGLAVIFGLLGLVNFAHGALYMMGAYVAWVGLEKFGMNYWGALVVAPVMVGAFGVAIERTLLRHLYKIDPIYGLLLTFGLALIVEGRARAVQAMMVRCGHIFTRLESLKVPTVAAVNGIALAGGLEMLLCCDIVVAEEGSKLGDGHAKFGQLPGGGGTARLPRRIGAARAKYLLFSGEALSAEQMLAWGLVDFVVPKGALTSHVDGMVVRFRQRSPLVLERMKWLVQQSAEQSMEAALEAEISLHTWHVMSYDRNEGLAAFAEKRVPRYVGR